MYSKAVAIKCVLCFKRKTPKASFEYKYLIEDGIIRFLPVDDRTMITNIYSIGGLTKASASKNQKTVVINLDTIMTSETGDFAYFMETDDLSNGAIISPDSELTSFTALSIKDS